jgi:hypothetical protein
MMAEDKALSFLPFIPAAATLIAALVGSFLGPLFAFKLQKQEKEQKIKTDNITAGNYAIFTVMCQFNRLNYVCKQMIDPVRTHPLKIVVMPPMQPLIEYEDLKFDMSSLSFFLKPQNSLELQIMLRQTLAELFIEYTKFQTAVSAINIRTEFLLQQAQPLLDKAKMRYYSQETPDQMQVGEETLSFPQDMQKASGCIETALGHLMYQRLWQITDNVIKTVDDTKGSLLSMRDKLVAALKQLFPENKRDILRFEPE